MSDITFGEVEDTTPHLALRPDRNAQFATVTYGETAADDLPIFVDLDVLCDLEMHAQSNTRVELGGVLLGGQWLDDEGRPFVTITEAIRAEHYEATRGSFKFTHDTWSSITRRREEFSPELAMVGWYHTHPNWGVFLSGMDQFICENFFKRPHDVALVIDPCRGDRGIFQWSGQAQDPLRRVRGFQVMTSRFREAELHNFVAQLEGSAMPSPSGVASHMPAPVIQIVEPRGGGAQQLAVLGMLSIQFCFLVLLAWRMLTPAGAAPEAEGKAVAQQRRDVEVQAERASLDRVLARLDEGTNGLATELKKSDAEKEQLRAAVTGYGALEQEKALLEKSLTDSRKTRDELSGELAALKEGQLKAQARAKEQAAQIAVLQKRLGETSDEGTADARSGYLAWSLPTLLAAIAVVVLLAGAMALVVARRRTSADELTGDAAEPNLARTVVPRKPVGVHEGG